MDPSWKSIKMEPLPFSTEGHTQPSEQLPLFEEPPRDEADKLSSPRSDDSTLPRATCFFCGRHVDPKSDTTYAEVRSWISGPKKDSAVLRQYTGRYADNDCISLLRAGMHPSQKTLEETADATPSAAFAEFELFPTRSPEWEAGFQDGFSGSDPRLNQNDEYSEGYSDGVNAVKNLTRMTIVPIPE